MLATLQVILPAAIIVAAGYIAGKRVMDGNGIKALSDLVFFLFLPCLLFRAMATSSFDLADGQLLITYFSVTMIWFFAVVFFSRNVWKEAIPGAVTLGVTGVFSNLVQLGVPIQKLAFGDAGLKLQLSIVALHSLIIITSATLWIEIWRAKRAVASDSLGSTVIHVIKQSLIHPVILPILAGLSWNALGIPMPSWLDQPLSFLSSAAGPIMLVLMGAQLSKMALKENIRAAAAFTLIKNFLHPLLMFAACYAFGLSPLYTAVAVVCASLPTGSNAFIFAQRYRANEDMVTAAIAVSSIVSVISITLALTLLPKP